MLLQLNSLVPETRYLILNFSLYSFCDAHSASLLIQIAACCRLSWVFVQLGLMDAWVGAGWAAGCGAREQRLIDRRAKLGPGGGGGREGQRTGASSGLGRKWRGSNSIILHFLLTHLSSVGQPYPGRGRWRAHNCRHPAPFLPPKQHNHQHLLPAILPHISS